MFHSKEGKFKFNYPIHNTKRGINYSSNSARKIKLINKLLSKIITSYRDGLSTKTKIIITLYNVDDFKWFKPLLDSTNK